MEKEHYYHMFANGDDAKNFITDESEFKAAFNRFALCQYLTGAVALSQHLRKQYRISYRQLSSLVGIPESELRKYVK